jgi:antitoxin (DNA-binding transcriptional repressor) of toxin-antitoxin stability system
MGVAHCIDYREEDFEDAVRRITNGRGAREEAWVLTRRGKPFAAVVPIRSRVDLESFALSHNPRFIEIINRSWASYLKDGGISLEKMRRHTSARRSARRRAAGLTRKVR